MTALCSVSHFLLLIPITHRPNSLHYCLHLWNFFATSPFLRFSQICLSSSVITTRCSAAEPSVIRPTALCDWNPAFESSFGFPDSPDALRFYCFLISVKRCVFETISGETFSGSHYNLHHSVVNLIKLMHHPDRVQTLILPRIVGFCSFKLHWLLPISLSATSPVSSRFDSPLYTEVSAPTAAVARGFMFSGCPSMQTIIPLL